MTKPICLGTAMWGWSVDESTAFQILEEFYLFGGRRIDTAYNYPLNGDVDKLMYPSRLISDWMRAHGVNDLEVTFKIGSTSNVHSRFCDLSDENIDKMYSLALKLFGDCLSILMIHWDDRNCKEDIEKTLIKLASIKPVIGLSGISSLMHYSDILSELQVPIIEHQVKSSFLNVEKKDYYLTDVSGDYRLWAYGICGSGLKLDETEYRSDSYVTLVRGEHYHKEQLTSVESNRIKNIIESNPIVNNLYQYSMLVKETDNRFYGYLVSPSSLKQMKKIIEFKNHLLNSRF